MFWLLLPILSVWDFHTLRFQVPVDRNPVPSPGAADIDPFWTQVLMPSETLHTFGLRTYSCRGEGWGPPSMGTPGATQKSYSSFTRSAKPHGTQPVCGFDQPWPVETSTVAKRSLYRAYKRACLHGLTWVRGRPMTPADFPPAVRRRALPHTPTSASLRTDPDPNLIRINSTQKKTRRLRLFSWNAGGMSQARLDELRLWLTEQSVEVAIIVETRWAYTGEWEDQRWQYIHSSPGQGGHGILCMISKQVCPATQLRWQAVIPGRLVHLQLRLRYRNIDVLACYQHVYDQTRNCLHLRKEWWQTFEQYLRALPTRNVLAIAGDFNCGITSLPTQIGSAGYRWDNHFVPSVLHPDHGQLMSIIRSFGLVGLNT